MNKKIFLAFFVFLVLPFCALASDPSSFGSVSPFAGTSSGSIVSSIQNIVNGLLGLVALIAVIVIAFSTYTALSAGDGEEIAAKAKNTIIYALLGLIIVGLSAVIVNFIINSID